MKKKIFLIMALFASLCGIAQTEGLPLDTIDGKVVYVYEVQKSEGIYRISKNFGISQEDLIRYNPKLATEGLKLGQKIYIPYVEKIDSSAYITHQLVAKETLYGLSRKYGVSVSELEALNPETSKRMAIGSTLLIKKKANVPAPKQETQVQVAELPKQVEKAVATAPKEIEEAIAEVVKEVKVETSEVALPVVETPIEAAPQSQPEQVTNEPQPVVVPNRISEVPLRLAFLLPFQTGATKRTAAMDRFVDFYEGALIAIYEAQREGQQFDIHTYDIRKEDIAIQHVLQKSELLNADAIIGPAYPAQVSHASIFAKQKRIPLLIPFTSKVTGLETNPYLWQFNPNVTIEANAVAQYLTERKESIHLIVIDNNEAGANTFSGMVERQAADSGMHITYTSMSAILHDTLTQILDKDKENVLLFSNDKLAAMQVMMPHINKQKSNYLISMVGHYSWVEDSPELPMLYASIFHEQATDKYAEYQSLYEHYFSHKPAQQHPRYDMLGYDLTKWLIRSLQQSQQVQNKAERNTILGQKYEGVQSDIHFTPVGEGGGLINANMQVVRYNK